MNKIPKLLVDDIRRGNVVLFLGAGASYGALNKNGKTVPLGNNLSDMIADRFLEPSYLGQPLSLVAEVANSQAGLLAFQSYIKGIFSEFEPAKHHELISTFKWNAIFTTNFDKVVEKSYAKNTKSIQELEAVYRNTFTDEVFKNARSLPYYKLHGCIDCINDDALPLILTPDQYSLHRLNRENLFRQLETLAYDHTIVFVGFSFADWDIREAIRMAQGKHTNRAKWYLVGPHIRDAERTMYEEKRIGSIVCGFDEFLQELDTQIPKNIRDHYFGFTQDSSHPFFKLFLSDCKPPTDTLRNFIESDVDYIFNGLSSDPIAPKDFYKGYFQNWDPILKNLDAKRVIEDTIISDVYIDDNVQASKYPYLYVILGHAGAGKSVLLKRLAFNSGVVYEQMSFVLKSDVVLKYEPIYELYQKINTRFFIHVDNLVENSESIREVISRAKKDNIPVSIVTTERHNVWNIEYEELKKWVTSTYSIEKLNKKEIIDILTLLERHNSLGHLASKSFDERIIDVEERSQRQLLVALHEATSGKPFQDIIRDEYNSILDQEAKSLYLTVCIFHRLGASARAGLISRVHGIRFDEFNKKLFKPLEYIVFAKENKRIRDMVYETRHRQIAELVFESILVNEQERYDEYHRVISNLNIDFESDRIAYLAMTKAKNLLELFSDPMKVRRLYDIAEEAYPDDPRLLQQRAIYELKRPNPNTGLAMELLNTALRLAPDNIFIMHTKSELLLEKAYNSDVKLLKDKLLQECEQLCNHLISKDKTNIHPYHTVLKVKIHRLSYYISKGTPNTIEKLIKDFEKNVALCKQLFPNDPLIYDAESKFSKIINDQPQAFESLEKAYNLNKSSPYMAIRLSNLIYKRGNLEVAIKICEDTIALNPNDKDVHFQLAYLLSLSATPNYAQVAYLYKKSFTIGDTRYEAQFWYARACYILKDYSGYKDIISVLSKAKIYYDDKIAIRGLITMQNHPIRFTGKIIRLEYGYGIIRRDDFGDTIYFNRNTELVGNKREENFAHVEFAIGFNFKGANAVSVIVLG